MEIKKLNSITSKKQVSKQETKKNEVEQRKESNSSLNCYANYNIGFMGLRKKETPIKDNFIDASNSTETIKMEAFQEYKISDDSIISLDDFVLNFQNPEVKAITDNLKEKESVIIGRNATRLQGMPQSVSREHLKLSRDKNGNLFASDLNSTYGSKILPNVTILDVENRQIELARHQKYEVPENAILKIGNTNFNLFDINRLISSLKSEEKITIGRLKPSDITIKDPAVSSVHLEIAKGKNGVLVKDLGSKNGTTLVGLSQIQTSINYNEDYFNEKRIRALKPSIPTLLPRNCQINLGGTFTLDTRNKNFLKFLDKKGAITIGRNTSCDMIVNSFHEQVSNRHLKLEKSGDFIIATDLNPTNPTHIIPQNKIKAFYTGVKNIRLAQSNIGDCYLLSTIYSLSQTPKGQKLLENMVRVDSDGNYHVQFFDKKPIKVTLEELDGQQDKKGKEFEKISVSGELGAKALERAYAKLIKNPYVPSGGQTLFMEIDDGGFMDKALKDMTGIESKRYRVYPENTAKTFMSILNNGLENSVVTCSTPKLYNGQKYVDAFGRFLENHAYSIKSVDYRRQLVEIVNPHNTQKTDIVSWDDFNKIFDYICVAQI